jgi:Tfp pilus assembly protein PilF
LYSVDYQNYEQFRILNREFDQALSDKNITLSSQQIEAYLSSNPDYWMVYYKLGEYYLQKGYDRAAAQAFQKALTKEITTLPNRQMIVNKLKKINL